MNLSEVGKALPFPSSRELLRAVGRGEGWGAPSRGPLCVQAGPHPNPPHGSASLRRGREREAAASIKKEAAPS
jgi:hypothetical protein